MQDFITLILITNLINLIKYMIKYGKDGLFTIKVYSWDCTLWNLKFIIDKIKLTTNNIL
jgi:hypothetical protein